MLSIASLPPLSITHAQPLPKRPTPAFFTSSLNLSKPPNDAVDRVGDRAGRRAAGVRAHDLPEHRVVRVAAAVVAHRGADVSGTVLMLLQQILDALRLQLGMLLERGVQIRHVGLVMLAVMNLHRLLVDVRFERVGRRREAAGSE